MNASATLPPAPLGLGSSGDKRSPSSILRSIEAQMTSASAALLGLASESVETSSDARARRADEDAADASRLALSGRLSAEMLFPSDEMVMFHVRRMGTLGGHRIVALNVAGLDYVEQTARAAGAEGSDYAWQLQEDGAAIITVYPDREAGDSFAPWSVRVGVVPPPPVGGMREALLSLLAGNG